CMENLKAMHDLKYAPEQAEFALKLQQTLDNARPLETIGQVLDKSGEVGMGSTDVGDISWVVPTTGFNTACWPPGTPGPSCQHVASGRKAFAKQGMVLAARVLAATAHDAMTKPEVIQQAQAEFARRVGQNKYQSLMQPGQKPALNYRNRTSVAGAVTE